MASTSSQQPLQGEQLRCELVLLRLDSFLFKAFLCMKEATSAFRLTRISSKDGSTSITFHASWRMGTSATFFTADNDFKPCRRAFISHNRCVSVVVLFTTFIAFITTSLHLPLEVSVIHHTGRNTAQAITIKYPDEDEVHKDAPVHTVINFATHKGTSNKICGGSEIFWNPIASQYGDVPGLKLYERYLEGHCSSGRFVLERSMSLRKSCKMHIKKFRRRTAEGDLLFSELMIRAFNNVVYDLINRDHGLQVFLGEDSPWEESERHMLQGIKIAAAELYKAYGKVQRKSERHVKATLRHLLRIQPTYGHIEIMKAFSKLELDQRAITYRDNSEKRECLETGALFDDLIHTL